MHFYQQDNIKRIKNNEVIMIYDTCTMKHSDLKIGILVYNFFLIYL